MFDTRGATLLSHHRMLFEKFEYVPPLGSYLSSDLCMLPESAFLVNVKCSIAVFINPLHPVQ